VATAALVPPVILVLLVLLVLLCAGCGSAPPRGRPAPPSPRPVLSRYETATGRVINRDCGYSAPLPGKPARSLWLFCDTAVLTRQGKEIGFPILGTGTAAQGQYRPGRLPGVLTEVGSPGTRPAGAGVVPPRSFLPAPAGLTLPDSFLPCTGPGVYPARWFSGVTREPASGHLLISYDDYCVSGTNVFTPEAFGLLDYDPAASTLASPAQVVTAPPGQRLPPRWVLGSPVFSGGYLYLFSGTGAFLARTPAAAASWQDAFTYQYWTGTGWSASPDAATPLSGQATGAVWAGDFAAQGHGLVMIEQTSVAGDFSIWQAAAPTGPWHRIETGRVPCRAGIRQDSGGLCRALIGHPELSTRSELLMSFFDPAQNHVEAVSYPW